MLAAEMIGGALLFLFFAAAATGSEAGR